MTSVNKVILVGNLGKDPVIRFLPNGNKVASFPIATSESWKNKTSGEKKERTEWHPIVVMNASLAEVAEKYLKKGSKVYLEGQLQTRLWTDKEGKERQTTEIVLSQFKGVLVLLDKANESPAQTGMQEAFYGAVPDSTGRNSTSSPPSYSSSPASDFLDDDVPF